MPRESSLSGRIGLLRGNLILVSLLLANNFAWFYLTKEMLNIFVGDFKLDYELTLIIWGIYYFTASVSGLVTSLIVPRMKRLNLIYCWFSLGIVTSFLSLMPFIHSQIGLLILAFLFGASVNLGLPSCLAYFADNTTFENRGRVAGLILFLSFLCTPLLIAFLKRGLFVALVLSLIWRGWGLIFIKLLKNGSVMLTIKEELPISSIFQSKTFRLYFISWILFNLVDNFEKAYFSIFFSSQFFDVMTIVESLTATLSVFFIGLLFDIIGRKKLVICSFIILGLGYATISLAPFFQPLFYLYFLIEGIAWSILTVTFILVVWGDLSISSTPRERYYAVGSIPFFFSQFLAVLVTPYMQGIPRESAFMSFSLASFFLFLAVVPLMYAPETLPEKLIRRRELRSYVEKAKKLREKYTGE